MANGNHRNTTIGFYDTISSYFKLYSDFILNEENLLTTTLIIIFLICVLLLYVIVRTF